MVAELWDGLPVDEEWPSDTMPAAAAGPGRGGLVSSALLVFCNDVHSCDNWRKINSVEKNTKKP